MTASNKMYPFFSGPEQGRLLGESAEAPRASPPTYGDRVVNEAVSLRLRESHGTPDVTPQTYRIQVDDAVSGRLAEVPTVPHMILKTYGILVVDDEEGVRGVLNAGLRQQGFTVWLAAHGQEALDLYQRHHETIDLVLMDVRMPGLDGPQTLAALQELNPRIRCCFMSGNLGRYTEERLRTLSGTAVLRKPFHLAEVAQMLWEQAVKEQRGRADDQADSPAEGHAEPSRKTKMRLQL